MMATTEKWEYEGTEMVQDGERDKLPKLLVVDDQPINIEALHHIFGRDHQVFKAISGAQALAFCANNLPDIVLLDVMMPDMGGHEVCRRLKADPHTRDIPVVFVTAHTDPAEEALGLELGAVDYISKPVNATVVRARVHTHLLLRRTLGHVRELNETLELRVKERSDELELAQQDLQQSQTELASSQAKAALNTLVASVSHELSTPLGNSVMMISTLDDQTRTFTRLFEAGSIKRSDLAQYIKEFAHGVMLVQRNLQRANELLVDFRQVATDQASEQRRRFNLADMAREIIHTITPSLKRHPHKIALNIPAEIEMNSVPGPLGQVIINLINNAYLHGFEHSRAGLLSIDARVDGERVRVSVADNGCGIDAEHLEKLFLPFFSTKIGQGGTGLGLAIVRNLVTKSLGGEISVHSTLGSGTVFELDLPCILPDTPADPN